MVTTTNPTDGAQTRRIIALTQADDSYDLDRNDCPCLIHNSGATGAVTVNLPTDAKGGEEVTALCLAAQDLALNPGSGNQIYADDATAYGALAAGKSLIGDALGESVTLIALGDGDWVAVKQTANDAAAGAFNEEQA